ncbi:MAG: DUF111 family protein [Spirochaetales bacterium]|nr:DUF111 family protein [Spirochaetales bacterium]
MWYLDVSGGISPASLYVAMVKIIENKKQQFIDECNNYFNNMSELFREAISPEKIFDPVSIYNKFEGQFFPESEEAVKQAGDLSSILTAIISFSGEKTIGYYDYLLYLLLIILLEKMNLKEQIRILPPRINTNSGETVFQLLKGIVIILDPQGLPVSTMCSAFCHYYENLFIARSEGMLLSFINLKDPFNKNNIRLFKCDAYQKTDTIDGYEYDVISVLETNIDDSTPEIISGAMTALLTRGALDYTISPVMMKKGRSGFQIQVLCNQSDSERIAEELLHQTSTFGLRISTTLRKKLSRRFEKIQTAYGEVTVKCGYQGDNLIKATPEFDDLNRIAIARGIPLFNLYSEIMGEIKKGIDCFVKDGKIERL